MTITIYSTTTCPFCNMMKEFLKEKGQVFTEKLVDQDDAARQEMIQKSAGYLGVPFAVIVKDTGEEVKIVGFDKNLLTQTLGL